MQVVRLGSETDFEGWRAAARRLRRTATPPETVLWTVTPGEVLTGGPALNATRESTAPSRGNYKEVRVPGAFLELARGVVQHRSPDRFALLYRLLWRLDREPGLMSIGADPDIACALAMAGAVTRAADRMKAFVRFQRLEDVRPESYAAWFEPEHRVLEQVAPFFIERFSAVRFSILTPEATLRWDTETALFGPGGEAAGLSGAALKPVSFPTGRATVDRRIEPAPTSPSARARKAAARLARDGTYDDVPQALDEVVAGIEICRRCELWRNATRSVPGEGAAHARLMIVGEQPGDQEDLAGKPFVGPAGQLLDRALETAGVPRERTFVTNAVKHFKNEPHGRDRRHQTPTTSEVHACRWWLDSERRLVKPRVILALGATAAQALLGKPTPVMSTRGRAIALPGGGRLVVSYHPSYLLRTPDEPTRERAWADFVGDLALAWSLTV